MKKTRFYKRISISLTLLLFSLVLIFSSRFTLAQEINYCSQPGAVPRFTKLNRTDSVYDPWWINLNHLEYINDNNVNTYVGFCGSICGFYGNLPALYECEVDFPQVVSSIVRIEYTGYVSGHWNGRETVFLWYNGVWNQIGQRFDEGNFTNVINGAWSNVSKIKIQMRAQSGSWMPSEGIYLYELRAFGQAGPVYQDIGLRVFKGTEIVAIAAEIGPPTSPLRIAKNGIIYGIALINQTDPEYGDPQYDSGVRIQTSSDIKALRKYP